MADRSSIASRIDRLLQSGWEVATLLTRLNFSKDSEVSRALTNLNSLLGILRSLRPTLQSREFQTRITVHFLQTLDDAVLRCDEILRDIQEDIQEEKNSYIRNRTEVSRTVERGQSTWQSLSSRMVDESSHLLFALHQILPAEGQEPSNLNPPSIESTFVEETSQLRSFGDAESDSLATQEDSRQPSVCIMPLVNSDSINNNMVEPALGSVSAIGELVQMILEHAAPNNLCSLIPQQAQQSSSLRATSPPARQYLPVERFLLDLGTEFRAIDDLQGLIIFLRSNIDIIVREYERNLISRETKLDINALASPGSNPREELHQELEEDQFLWPTMRLYSDLIKNSDAFQRLREAPDSPAYDPDNRLETNEQGSEENTIRINLSLFFSGLAVSLADLVQQSHVYRRTLKIFSDIGLMETALPPGCVRFRWRNRHGKVLYDDYIENEPESLQRLREYFDGYTHPVKTVNEGLQGQKIPDSAPSNAPTSISSFRASGSSGATAVTPPSASTEANEITITDIEKGLTHSRTKMLLLLCIERSGYPDTLHQENTTDILDDNQLFRRLRRVHRERIGKFKSFWSLRTLGSIQFMKFIYEGHPHIDVRCHNDLCEKGRCVCVPPADLVVPKGSEYDCSPIPPGLSPPVGSKHMMDLFYNPDGYRAGATRVIQQIPKRVNEGLKESSNGPVEAWGICFKEDWNRFKIWWLIMIIFGLTSLIFGILWGILQKDVEGAFGIAGWWMTGATVFIGIIGIYS